ncbi:MAG: four helix bundle protein [Chthoniobacterales bacterium]|nr:MAG: four helix bundle protein [Chthoniobacterales bacterium]
MEKKEFLKRTMNFGLRVIRLVNSLPKQQVAQVLGNQLLRAGTSVGANYRAAVRGKSRADFIAKMGIVEEECDETLYWMEMLSESHLVKPDLLHDLVNEGNQILSIVVASIRTARRNK